MSAFLLAAAQPGDMFGHHPYKQAPKNVLASAGKYRATGRVVRMRRPAAEAFRRMSEAAAKDGLRLIPISGFRTIQYQQGLFSRAVKRYGGEQAAARWVAPPGHSEHHTGWTLDLGDGDRAAMDVDQSFEKSPVFAWLQKNAATFGFEISFPKNNAQGVSYEPWHWRYIGSDESRALFHGKKAAADHS